MRLVIDTNVVVSAAFSKNSPPHRIVILAIKSFTLLMSKPLADDVNSFII